MVDEKAFYLLIKNTVQVHFLLINFLTTSAGEEVFLILLHENKYS